VTILPVMVIREFLVEQQVSIYIFVSGIVSVQIEECSMHCIARKDILEYRCSSNFVNYFVIDSSLTI
jgi:hypothetical protein